MGVTFPSAKHLEFLSTTLWSWMTSGLLPVSGLRYQKGRSSVRINGRKEQRTKRETVLIYSKHLVCSQLKAVCSLGFSSSVLGRI